MNREEGAACPLGELCIKCCTKQTAPAEAQLKPEDRISPSSCNLLICAYEFIVKWGQGGLEINKNMDITYEKASCFTLMLVSPIQSSMWCHRSRIVFSILILLPSLWKRFSKCDWKACDRSGKYTNIFRVQIPILGWSFLASKVPSDTPYLSPWCTKLSEIWYAFNLTSVTKLNKIFAKLIHQELRYGVSVGTFEAKKLWHSETDWKVVQMMKFLGQPRVSNLEEDQDNAD